MAKRRSKEELNSDKIIKKALLKLGDAIYKESTKTSRIAKDTFYKSGGINKAGGTLRDSQNYRVKPDTVLSMAQVHYGQYNYPKGKNSGQKNALIIAVDKYLPKSVDLIVTEITAKMIQNFK